MPLTTSDYTPYVEERGSPPTVGSTWTRQLPAHGAVHPHRERDQGGRLPGTIITPLYTDILLKPLAGTIAYAVYNAAPNAGLTHLEKDLDAIKPGTKVTTSNRRRVLRRRQVHRGGEEGRQGAPHARSGASGLGEADLGDQGLLLSRQLPGVDRRSPACTTVLEDTDGSAWKVVVPYFCSSKTFKVKG